MTGDFNIKDSLWNPSFPFHASISDDLIMIADSLDLALSSPTNPGPTRFSNTAGELNSVIDLMFLWHGSEELDHHSILNGVSLQTTRLSLSTSPSLKKPFKHPNSLYPLTANKKLSSSRMLFQTSANWTHLILKTSTNLIRLSINSA